MGVCNYIRRKITCYSLSFVQVSVNTTFCRTEFIVTACISVACLMPNTCIEQSLESHTSNQQPNQNTKTH